MSTNHQWGPFTAEDGSRHRACERCGARHGAWLTQKEREAVELAARIGAPPTRGDPALACGEGEVWIVPTGGFVRDFKRAEKTWRAHLGTPRRAGHPTKRTDGATMSLYLSADVREALIADPEGPSSMVERLVRAARQGKTTRQDFRALFKREADADAFEAHILKTARALLPPEAQAVRDGAEPTPAYWDFLAGQAELALDES